jgi:hypothetical protein
MRFLNKKFSHFKVCFFLEHAGELCIISLIEGERQTNRHIKTYTETHTHTPSQHKTQIDLTAGQTRRNRPAS